MKIKDFILCAITAVAFITFFASLMAIAEGSLYALPVFATSGGWLYVFCKVNKKVFEC